MKNWYEDDHPDPSGVTGPEDQIPAEEKEVFLALDRALAEEPPSFLPSGFPDAVVAAVERKEFIRDRLWQMLAIAAVLAFFIVVFALTSWLTTFSVFDLLFSLVRDYFFYWAGLLMLLALIQLADTFLTPVPDRLHPGHS